MHHTIRSGGGDYFADDSAKQAARLYRRCQGRRGTSSVILHLKPILSLVSMESPEPFEPTLC
jgi:hypothetical protein